ncbi:hypothetical protein EV363DRAFT_1396342 [Boletus edulis]|uniref:C2H2-type domain-containing protein n=1 Tax=Boletus edulis BED1 TaxID=1328754 RepID=A0AAD4BH76_BOLED|nr:hypothetical protein EV363DRAFT_1396342 [Boletus edulis]KAF8428856.1 hypothetical protein L210DRAFT_3117605 [Boletus edulis BED1]
MSRELTWSHNFTDADAARLCQLASIANDPRYRPYVCLWVTDGVVCNLHFQASEFPDHLRSAHGVVGADKASLMCCWVNCFAEMPKDCLMRHINENHLELRHICPICHEQFTRANTMQNHMSRKHSGN